MYERYISFTWGLFESFKSYGMAETLRMQEKDE